MSKINDEILRATGGATINDGLSSWFIRTATESLNDAEARWLFAQVAVTVKATINDMWLQFLGGSGAINDLKLTYWAALPTLLPVITVQPTGQTVTAPATATFTITATDATNYQWYRNDVEIPNAVSSSYTTPPTEIGDNGDVFKCVVSNSNADITSNNAILTVS